MPPLTAQQITERTGPDGFVGASEISAIVGENPWSGPIDIWLAKTGRAAEEPENPRAKIGQRAEAIIKDWYAEDTRTDVGQLVAGTSTRHSVVHCVGCTPDFLVYAPSETTTPSHALQLKCVGARMALQWPEQWIPPYVECQVQLEAEVLGLERVDVGAWLGGTDWRIIQVRRDREFGEMLVAAAVDFWHCVTTDRPPMVDGSEAWKKYLAARYPKVERQGLDQSDATVDEWAGLALKARDDEAEAVERKKLADNRLRDLIADGTGFLGPDYVVTWSPDKNGKRSLRIKRREFKGAI